MSGINPDLHRPVAPKEKGAPLARDAFEVFRVAGAYSFLEASSKMSPRFVRSEAPELFANWS